MAVGVPERRRRIAHSAKRRHGAKPPTEFSGDRFVAFTQNHDQVGNRAKSDRYDASLTPAATRCAAGILLLAPRLPLLFMGQEYGETNPFPFFCDFQSPDLIEAVREGRKKEFSYFSWEGEVPDPFDPATRGSAVLSWDWTDDRRAGLRRLYRDLLALRRNSPILRDFGAPRATIVGDAATGRLMQVERRSGHGGLTILFNLQPEPVPVPIDLRDLVASFRSEVPAYGHPAVILGTGQTLLPWEFVIYGDLPPIG